ncbi:nitroreductase [Chitinophaga skermanii]|uniref:Nitroreductase n=1 Tax=Chitinophaga skermanii TaxID=331697 RepID=A0A327QI80_9BACT|nr:NAD(P)H-dependent oxidoreductase [Chitinophaga skermanii]RAJ04001.1 nitroreductase [Chitinophaga skermanii]
MSNNILDQLTWRYATKKFDSERKIDEAQLDRILKATNLSASSYGLQPYKVLVIQDPAIREQLKAVSWNQSQITDASHLIVFARVDDLNDSHVDAFVHNIAVTRGVPESALEQYAGLMKGKVGHLNATEGATAEWTGKQAYLALGTLLTASAVEGIDACPMEGFDPAQYDEILGLKDKNLRTVVIAAVGYRAADDAFQHMKKVRKPLEEFIEFV